MCWYKIEILEQKLSYVTLKNGSSVKTLPSGIFLKRRIYREINLVLEYAGLVSILP